MNKDSNLLADIPVECPFGVNQETGECEGEDFLADTPPPLLPPTPTEEFATEEPIEEETTEEEETPEEESSEQVEEDAEEDEPEGNGESNDDNTFG